MRLRVWRWTTEEGGGWCYYKRLGSAPNKLPHINEILLQPHHHTRANISISTLTLQLPVLYSSSNLQAPTNITPDLFEIIQISSSPILISFGDTGEKETSNIETVVLTLKGSEVVRTWNIGSSNLEHVGCGSGCLS